MQKALQEVNNKTKDLSSELKQVDRLLKLDPSNVTLLAQKQKLLADSVQVSSDKLLKLKDAQKQVEEQFENGKIGEDQYRALQREVQKSEQDLKNLELQAIKVNAVLSKDEAIGNLKKIGTVAAGTAVAVGAAFVGMGIAALNNADELQKQADVTGLSAERLQELQYAGADLGVELDTITGAQAKLTKSMFAAQGGTGKQADAFKALGISVLDSNGNMRDAKAVMEEAFTALNGVGNETERDQLAMQLFGKSAMEMNPLIKAGGDELNRLAKEARNNGAVMSNEAVAGLDLFGDTIDHLKSSVLGSFGEKFAKMLPQIQGFLDKLKELPQWIQKNSTLLEVIGIVIGTITALVIAFNIQQALMASGLTLWTAIAGVATTVTTALGVAIAFLTSPIGIVIIAIGSLIAIFTVLWKTNEDFRNFFINAWTSIKDFFTVTLDGLINIAKTKFGFIFDSIMSVFKAFKALFQGDFKGFLTGIWDMAVTWASGWINIGQNIVSGVWQGIQNMASWFYEQIKSFFSNAIASAIATAKSAITGSSSSGGGGSSGGSSSNVVSVGADGKAPKGLSAGTIVKTAGGNYKITGVNSDGSYKKTKVSSYATGGVADFTGLAQLDGTKSKSETIFNSGDSKKLYDLIHNMPSLTSYFANLMKSSIGAMKLNLNSGSIDSKVNIQMGNIIVQGSTDQKTIDKIEQLMKDQMNEISRTFSSLPTKSIQYAYKR